MFWCHWVNPYIFQCIDSYPWLPELPLCLLWVLFERSLPWGFWWPPSLVWWCCEPAPSSPWSVVGLLWFFGKFLYSPSQWCFPPNSSQILLVTAMYSVIGTLEELTANFGPFCRIDCSPLLSGLLDKFITHFFLMMSGTGVFSVSELLLQMIELLICQLFVILNTFSLDLYITSTISLKSLLLNLFLKLVLILFMWDSIFW